MQNKKRTYDFRPCRAPIHATPGWPTGAAELLIDLWNGGLSAAQAAARLGTTKPAVECKVHKLRFAGFALIGRRPRGPRRLQCAKRTCLYCGETFASTHIGNRICAVCLEYGPFTSAIA